MKTLNHTIGILLVLGVNAVAQPQFTAVKVTDEGAMQLYWQSEPHHLYEIDEADALVDTNTGSITWNKLYDDYPSHGTNTFIGDFGNYNLAPQIPHPKNSPMRFYRVVDAGVDPLPDAATVSIISQTNGAIVSGETSISVLAATLQPVFSGTKLYVDGQEMLPPESTTNWNDGTTNYEMDTYSINTCEWGNETHVLFATVSYQSGYGDPVDAPPVVWGYAVSPYVSVLFNNLVTRISFSQPSFDPASGQTQQVSAVFPLNSDWTLNIVDVYSNIVKTATGSGNSMLVNWDGTDNTGANLPNGIYYYYITAQTNGQPNENIVGGGSGGSSGGNPPAPDFARPSLFNSDVSELWAMPENSDGDVAPFALYPPGIDTNSLTVFSASPLEINMLRAAAANKRFNSTSGGFSPAAAGDPGFVTPLPDPQPSPVTPQRPPNNPVRGLAGTFGVAYDTYSANGTNGISVPPLDNGLNLHLHITMNNLQATNLIYKPLNPFYNHAAKNFISEMTHWGWQNTFNYADNQFNIGQLRGSGTIFNNVTVGLLLLHGAYGTGGNGLDYAANQCRQMYFPITSGGSAQYLRFSEMNLGGSGTNGLKWMAIHACNSLYHVNWSDMQSKGVKPYNSNLHLLLGCDTISYASPTLPWYWSRYMNYGTSTNAGNSDPLTIREAWYQGAQTAFQNQHFPQNLIFAVAGDSACMDDKLQTNNVPTGSWSYDTRQIYTMH